MSAIADHLWQSTWFALAAALLALFVRKDAAKVRHWVWTAASLKFLFPFALLSWIGNQFVFQVEDDQALLPIVRYVTSPLTTATTSMTDVSMRAQQIVTAVWLIGTVALIGRWLANWLYGRAILRSSMPCAICAPIPVRCSNRLTVPGVIGIVEPVLLLPTHVPSSLSAAQMETVIAHEMWHVRRRDNLIAALHALVEALFWFHPLVWWIGAKLVHEREHACDEGVIQDGNERTTYAETLLIVSRRSLESRLAYAVSATGGDLGARIRSIMSPRGASKFGNVRRAVLVAGLLGCTALPIASGMTVVTTSAVIVAVGAHTLRVSEPSGPAFIVMREDYIYGRNVSLRELIGRAYAVRARDVTGSYRWLDHPRYDVEIRPAVGGSSDHRQLVAELLERQFNMELIMRPTPHARGSE